MGYAAARTVRLGKFESMTSNGVIRSYTTLDGRKVVSIKPAAMEIAKQAAKDVMAKRSEGTESKTAGIKRDTRR